MDRRDFHRLFETSGHIATSCLLAVSKLFKRNLLEYCVLQWLGWVSSSDPKTKTEELYQMS